MTGCETPGVPLVVEPDVDVPNDVRAACRVFGTPLRVAMLHSLAQTPMTTGDLADELDLAIGTLPKNLRALEAARAITGTPAAGQRRGRTVRWHTDVVRVRELADALAAFVSGGVAAGARTPPTS